MRFCRHVVCGTGSSCIPHQSMLKNTANEAARVLFGWVGLTLSVAVEDDDSPQCVLVCFSILLRPGNLYVHLV